MSRRFDTTPTPEDRELARKFLSNPLAAGRDWEDAVRLGRAYAWLSATVDDLTEAVTEEQARAIAGARAIRDAYEETTR